MDCLSSSILQFPKKKSNFECSVHRYVCRRFQLEEDTSETDLYKLAVASIRKLKPGLTQKRVEELLAGSDCHQTTYAVQKKILIMMELERLMDVQISQDKVETIQTTKQCADIIYELCQQKERRDV